MALRGRVPEIPRRRENKRPPARPSTFRASVVGVVGRRPRRGATVDTRATRDALFRETRAPRLVSRETRADRSALPAASPPRASAVRRRVSRVSDTTRFPKNNFSLKKHQAYLCVACDGNVHAANSIASTHERTPVSVFTEEGVSGGRGAPEHSGSAGDDDGLFADLLAGGGDAFAGLPEMDGGAGFLVDDPNDTTTETHAHARVKQEHQEHVEHENVAAPRVARRRAAGARQRRERRRAQGGWRELGGRGGERVGREPLAILARARARAARGFVELVEQTRRAPTGPPPGVAGRRSRWQRRARRRRRRRSRVRRRVRVDDGRLRVARARRRGGHG